MDDLINPVSLTSIVIAVLSAGFSFFNRERYKTLIKDIYQPGNDELRSQLSNARTENTELEKENATYKASLQEREKYVKQLEELNQRLPDITELTKLISNNHTEVIKEIASLGKVIAGKPNGQ